MLVTLRRFCAHAYEVQDVSLGSREMPLSLNGTFKTRVKCGRIFLFFPYRILEDSPARQ